MLSTIFSALAVSAVITIFGFITKALTDWSAREKKKDEAATKDVGRMDAIEAVHMGINTIGETVVKEMKLAASDGKLSKDEIKNVQRLAIVEAIKIATNPAAIEFLTKTAFDTISAIITSIVQGKKPKP